MIKTNKPHRKKKSEQKYYRVTIPTKTYLKKFINYYEGDPPIIDNSSHFKTFAFAMLSFSTIRDKNYRPKNLSEVNHNDKLTMLVSARTFTHIGHSITMEKAMYLNRFMSFEFAAQLVACVINLHVRKGATLKDALTRFCDIHNIEVDVDITMDNLIKIWQRRTERIEPFCLNNTVTECLIVPFQSSRQLALFQ